MKLLKYLKLGIASMILFFSLANFSVAANVSFFTSSKAYTTGSDIVLNILVSSAGKPATAVSGIISFPVNLLSVSSISKDDSIVSKWIQEPSFSNSTGHINFETVLLSGLTGNLGKILTVTFKAKSVGTANINFLAGSIVTVDGVGEDILLNSEGTFITITKANGNTTDVISEIKPDLDGWYSLDTTKLPRISAYYKIPAALIISVALLIILLSYMYQSFFGKNNKLKKEVSEAESAIRKAFDILKESEKEQIKTLEKSNLKEKSKIKKEKVKRQFKKDLEDAEKYIEKEIGDIEKELK